MDPSDNDNLSPEKQITISKRMFYGGFFFLPWLWLYNYIYYREFMNKSNTPPVVRFYARSSLIGFIIWTVILLIWIVIYQLRWNNWGATGENISLVISSGPM